MLKANGGAPFARDQKSASPFFKVRGPPDGGISPAALQKLFRVALKSSPKAIKVSTVWRAVGISFSGWTVIKMIRSIICGKVRTIGSREDGGAWSARPCPI